MKRIILNASIKKRQYWVSKIKNLKGNFTDNVKYIDDNLVSEVKKNRKNSLVDHLRLCGNIPESYPVNSSEEKLYSKYTDILLSIAYRELGLKSIVLTERGDAADVEAYAKNYSFVADAKAFRLSRTAKNQKDFKILAMDGWRRGKPYAMVVCPIYQLPNRTSQIYHQASTKHICIFTYSHLSLLVNHALTEGKGNTERLLHEIFKTIPAMNPSKSAINYWQLVNKTILGFSKVTEELWRIEKEAAVESTKIVKEEGLRYWDSERESIMKMTHARALEQLVKMSKIDNKIEKIESVLDNGIFDMAQEL